MAFGTWVLRFYADIIHFSPFLEGCFYSYCSVSLSWRCYCVFVIVQLEPLYLKEPTWSAFILEDRDPVIFKCRPLGQRCKFTLEINQILYPTKKKFNENKEMITESLMSYLVACFDDPLSTWMTRAWPSSQGPVFRVTHPWRHHLHTSAGFHLLARHLPTVEPFPTRHRAL